MTGSELPSSKGSGITQPTDTSDIADLPRRELLLDRETHKTEM